MDPGRYLKAFRRRWAWIVACVIVALAAGWITTETVAAPPTVQPSVTRYVSDVLLLSDGTSADPVVRNPDILAVAATQRPVLENVAEILDYKGDAASLTPSVSVDPHTGILTISVTADDRQQAIERADAYVLGLAAYLRHQPASSISQQNGGPDEAASRVGLRLLAPPTASRISIGGGTSSTEITDINKVSRTGRLLIVGVLGLLAGLVLALILERFDTKVRTRRGAEERFGLPVIAEIPKISRKERRAVVPVSMPTSTAADAFRLLGAGVGVIAPHREGVRARTVLVTSPGPSDGKTTIVTNVAAALAEEGSRVLVVSADVRRPRVHEVFGVQRRPGLADAVKLEAPELKDFVQTSTVSNVWMVASGTRTSRPGAVVGSPQMRSLLEQARQRVDWIIIDTSPLLAATESALLLPEADLVLVVAMAKRTSATLARRSTEILDQLQVSTVRVVLNEAQEVVMPSGYRRYYRKIDKAAADDRDSSFGLEDERPEVVEHAENPDRGEG